MQIGERVEISMSGEVIKVERFELKNHSSLKFVDFATIKGSEIGGIHEVCMVTKSSIVNEGDANGTT